MDQTQQLPVTQSVRVFIVHAQNLLFNTSAALWILNFNVTHQSRLCLSWSGEEVGGGKL